MELGKKRSGKIWEKIILWTTLPHYRLSRANVGKRWARYDMLSGLTTITNVVVISPSENGHLEIVEALIIKGAAIDAKNKRKETALHLASGEWIYSVLSNLHGYIYKVYNIHSYI